MTYRVPIAPGLWTDEPLPRLIGGRDVEGRIRFPVPGGEAAGNFEAVLLSRLGTLWSWTVQSFEPKRPPFDGPVPFAPFTIGYVELARQVIVEARLVDVARPVIGMPLELAIVPFDSARDIFAFRSVT